VSEPATIATLEFATARENGYVSVSAHALSTLKETSLFLSENMILDMAYEVVEQVIVERSFFKALLRLRTGKSSESFRFSAHHRHRA
jgi:hypothetical protein